MARKRSKAGTFQSDGTDTRTSDQIEADLQTQQEAGEILAGKEVPTEVGSDPEVPETDATPEPEPELPGVDPDSGYPLKAVPEPEPEPEPEAAPEPSEPEPEPSSYSPEEEAYLQKHGFKSFEEAGKSWLSAARELGREQTKTHELEGRLAEQAQELARLKGYVEGAFEPESEPELTDDQLSELMSDPRRFAEHIKQQTARELDSKYQAELNQIKERQELERTQALIKERRDFALNSIPELKALKDAEDAGETPDARYIEFGQEMTEMIRAYPDLAQDNTKLTIAAEAARARVSARRTKAKAEPGQKGQQPKKARGDVFVESAKGGGPGPSRKKFADMTAAEMEKALPSIDMD